MWVNAIYTGNICAEKFPHTFRDGGDEIFKSDSFKRRTTRGTEKVGRLIRNSALKLR